MNVRTVFTSYESPLVLEEAVGIEQGFAQSPYGETGYAGKTVTTDDYGDF